MQTFLRRPDLVGLEDAWAASHPDLRERPETYWQPRTGTAEYFDRLFVNRWVDVQDSEIPLGRAEVGKFNGALSDHAPVVADLAALHPA